MCIASPSPSAPQTPHLIARHENITILYLMKARRRCLGALLLALPLALPSAAQESPPNPPTEAVSAPTPREEAPPPGTDATTAATAQDQASRRVFGFKDEVTFHRAAGWGSTGLLFAAGIVGAIRAWDLMNAGHEYRDANGIDEDEIGSACSAKITELWEADQSLRWVHVGLIISGETLYLADAVTGISWIHPSKPASTRSKIHRWAFYGHATLMAAEVALGFVTTDALKRGDHELVSSLGVAHAAIGLAIPILIGASGFAQTPPAR